MIGFIQQIRRRTPLGWLQLAKQKSRLIVAISGVAFADVLIMMQLGFQTALYDSNTRLHQDLNADLVLINPQGRNLINISTFPRRRLYQAMSVEGVKSADPLYVNIANWKNPETQKETNILVLGFNPNKPAFDLPELQQNLHLIKMPDTMLFDRAARGTYQETIAKISQGQTVNTELERRTINISGLYQVGASFAADGSLMTSDQNFLMLFPRKSASSVNIGLIELQPGYDPQQVATSLKAYLPSDVKVLTKQEFVEFEKNYWSTNTAIGFVFSLGVTMGFLVGVIIVYQVLSTDVNDHIGEYATFKAMGYSHAYFLGVVFEEAVILAILGFIPGVAVSLGMYRLTRIATNLPMYMTIARALQVLILTMIMCAISGVIATRKLQAADPADMF
ncbi:ABC transporter [[Phormidium ambiguum] IAM M-71]|uniref:ABC transporter n=1 Tax=[Phormidium ambiguum] IAM M-71 TaxID=454136 RepID=A0A1U7II11_9CYAN|nr:ABC transporter permease DevC [Phormidium ambiguum]OKH36684.1 ABC transporter [Phormidium ambiguum IAM M-71]